jgi:hypothetical protein
MVEGSRRSRRGQRTLCCFAGLHSVISATLDTHLLVKRVVFRPWPMAFTAACSVENHTDLLSPPAGEVIATYVSRQHVGSLMSAHLSLRSADGVATIRFRLPQARARARRTTLQGIARFRLTVDQSRRPSARHTTRAASPDTLNDFHAAFCHRNLSYQPGRIL